MASFTDLLSAAKMQTTSLASATSVASLADNGVEEPVTYSLRSTASTEEFQRSDKYLWSEEYFDDSYSVIDSLKNIKLSENQINLTQEANSQVIPFIMDRYYDGIDLMNRTLEVYFENKDGNSATAVPINVEYSDSKIRFYWLVDGRATVLAGKLKIAICAVGTNEFGQEYRWVTKTNEEINIIESLLGNGGVIEPNEGWNTYLEVINNQVVQAQAAATEAKAAAEEANNAVAEVDAKIADASDTIKEQVLAEMETELLKHYTKEEVDELLANIDISSQLESIESRVGTLETDFANFDGLANLSFEYDKDTRTLIAYNGEEVIDSLELNSDPSVEWVTAYDAKMDEKITTTTSAVQSDLDEYKEQTDADLASIHSAIDGLPQTLETDYYNKEATDSLLDIKADSSTVNELSTKVSTVETTANTNKENIITIGTKVANLEDKLNNVNTSSQLTYDVEYGEDNTFKFYEIENEGEATEVKTTKKQFVIQGGSGTSTSSVLKIEYVTKTPLVATVNDDIVIKYNFSGTDSSGDSVLEGAATWKVGNTVIATNTAVSGENSFDITEYINLGTQKVVLSITDEAGSLVTKSWTVQKIDVRLESTFNDKLTYSIGEVSFSYTPYGAISKVVHFILDGTELESVTTSASGIPMGYTLPSQEHGAHLLEVYITAEVNNNTIESNHIVKDIIWYDSTSTVPVIGTTYQNFTSRQYDATNIEYTVYDPTTETPTVEIAVDETVVSTPTLESATNVYSFKTDVVGEHTITITCGETVKTLKANIIELDIEVTPVTAGLVFDFNPSGKSNNDTDRVWSSGDIAMTVSDNFDWVNGGYQIDDAGDQYFCIKAGTSADINYQMFADDAKKTGKEMKFIFKTTNVQQADAKFLSCVDNTTGSDHIGIEMFVHEAYIYGSADKLNLKYSEDDIIEFEFNITNNTEKVTEICGYEDGVPTRHLVYDDSFNFTQAMPKTISLGSDKCDLHIYRFKIYNTSLTNRGVLSNFIADARNAEEMIDRYDRNQIYDENQELTPEILAEACPWLHVYKLSAPYFTNNKSDKVPYTTIQQIFKAGDPILDNWTCYDSSHAGQGTSSNNYGAAGRNLDFIMNKSQRDGVEPYFILGDGSTKVTEITLSRTSIPVPYLNFKANIASHNNFTNALLAKKYNENNPYKRPFVRADESIIPFIKDTMEFFNAVVFIQETDTTVDSNGNYTKHREFNDCDYHFYAIGNIGDSKKTDRSRLTDPDDKYECIVEIMDVDLPLSEWPVDTMINAMGYTTDKDTGVITYTWATDDNLGILYELIDGEYVLTSDTTVDFTKTYYVDILEQDDFSEDYTYGWRYLWEDGTDEQNAEVAQFCKNAWIQLYRFITTSTDEEFKTHFDEYFVKDSAIYFYLFTERYCMTDNRCKNSFWHFGKTGTYRAITKPIKEMLPVYCELSDGKYVATTDIEIDESKTYYTQYAFDLSFNYDDDTAMSLNNYGNSIYRHGYEDTDTLDGTTEEVFRESNSTFFCRLRDNFVAERKTMFNTLESNSAWHAESFLSEIEAWQNQFPEELWRIDTERKYVRTYNESFINGAGDPQFLKNMAQGKMKYTVKQWERSQEAYMASKYQSSTASSDNAVLRCTVPTGDLVVPVNYRLKLTPYDYMYLNVKYGTQNPIQVRAVPGVQYEIPFEGDSTDIIDIYSASRIQDLGDLSSTYPATVDTAKATRLKELHIGNSTEGYDNPYLTTMTLGANYLLEVLNIENVSGLTQSLNLSVLNNLRELYAYGTNAGGVTFANGGAIKVAELPAITAMSAKNLAYLTDLGISSYDKLTTLTIENCSTIDIINIFELASNLNRVRITGINWTLTDDTLLDRIYGMAGIDKNGYNVAQSVLAGKVHVPVIRQQKLYDYQTAWPDLEVTFDTMVEQFTVTFMNANGVTIETQYVDKGGNAIDPTTRDYNPIIPTIPSTVSHDFTFANWDSDLTNVFSDRIITATYTESLRSYTAKYVSKGIVMQETKGLYGDIITYNSARPTYTAEESAYVYYLFSHWDKSGYLDGNKTINAIFDKCEYVDGYFDGKELADLTPVEIYALTKLSKLPSSPINIKSILTEKDSYSFTLGYDIDYSDIASTTFISSKTLFRGSNYIDTDVSLFDEDRDFVIAIDYKFLSGCASNAVLAECFQTNGTNGFKLWYNSSSGVMLSWGASTVKVASLNNREMLIIRHRKGENNLTVYTSDLDTVNISELQLERNRTTICNNTLVFGCTKPEEGSYEDYAIGDIHWCKIWYTDLGDEICQKLAIWTREKASLDLSGFNRYYLTEDPNSRCTFSLLGSHLLERNRVYNSSQTNSGGWADSDLNSFLNQRLYNALPEQIKALVKQVTVTSSIGDKSTELSTSECYITIPSCIDVDVSMTNAPYYSEGKTISYMVNNDARMRTYDDGEAYSYWLRSPNATNSTSTSYYVWQVDASGKLYGFATPTSKAGVLFEISF